MKTIIRILVCLAIVAALCSPSVWGQSPPAEPAWRSKTVRLDSIDFTLPEFCSIEKVTTDELCTWPIAAAFAPDGSLVIAESVWNIKTKETVQQQLLSRPHRIVRLRDTDNDGKFDQRQVVADKLSFPEGVLCIGKDIYVTAPPEIWKLTDTDGDGVCEHREVWFDGTTLTGCANDLHGPWLGPDGWIYWTKAAFSEQTHQILSGKDWKSKASHLYRRHPSGGPIDPVMTGGMDNLVDIAWLPNGDRFFCATFLHHPRHGFRDGIGAATYGAVFGKPHGVLDGHPRTGRLMEPTAELGPAAPAGLLHMEALSGEFKFSSNTNALNTLRPPNADLPSDPQGFLLCAQFNLHQISLHRLEKPSHLAHYTADSYSLISSDRIDFHPVDLLLDADGSILVVDTGGWYDLCCPSSATDQRVATGGIYRIQGLSPDGRTPSGQRRALVDLSNALARCSEEQRPSIEKLYEEKVVAAMSDPDASVAMLACHMASLHRMQAARSKATQLLAGSNASLRRSAAEILGRIGVQSELQSLLSQIDFSFDDRTLRHSLIYALIEGAQDQPLFDALQDAVQAKRIFPSTAALVCVLNHREKLTAEHGDMILQMAMAPNQEMSEQALGILESHPQWSETILKAVSDRMQKSNLPPSDTLLGLLARWSDNPTVARWLADEILSRESNGSPRSLTPKVLSNLSGKAVPVAWHEPIAKRIEESSNQEASQWQSALQNCHWKGDTSAIQKAIGSILQKIESSGIPQEERVSQLLKWVNAMPKGSSIDGTIEETVVKQALNPAGPSESQAQAIRQMAWQCLSNISLQSPSSREQILEKISLAGPLELPVAIEAYCQGGGTPEDDRLLEALAILPAVKSLSVEGVLGKLKDRPADVQKKWRESLEAWTRPDQSTQDNVQQWLGKLTKGDAARGYHVFRSSKAACSACHQVGYVGGNVGPVLSKIGQSRSRRDLVEAILFPSARLEQAYRSTKVRLLDGEVLQGLVVSESPRELVLQVAADKRRSIDTADIEAREPSNVSIMPAGLESQLSLEELSDLIAFLENAK